MIASLSGRIQHKTEEYVIIEVAGIGYQVWVNPRTLAQLGGVEAETFLFTCLLYKEDRPVLYGFRSLREYDLFRLFTTVSGVGPKGALAILDIAPPQEIEQAIAEENVKLLSSVSGVGKRTAERLSLELKERVGGTGGGEDRSGGSVTETSGLTDALETLGYKPQQIQEAVKRVDATGDLQDQVKQALAILKH
jgi:Holliday junction DNA helicase RuvA